MGTSANFIILIAEDDEDDRFLLESAFAQQQPGCQIRIFHDGQQLLDALLQMVTHRLPALILLDLNMPVLNGITTLKRLKKTLHLCHIPVLILTTSDSAKDINDCYEAGANAFLTKPSSYTGLSQQIDMITRFWLQTAQLPTGR